MWLHNLRHCYAFSMNKAFCLSILAPVFISGCIFAPGTSPRTPNMSGRVLSATTRKPISGASVSLHEAPRLRATTTDGSGQFFITESRNFHFFVFLGSCGPDYNVLPYIRDDIDVSHPDYTPQQIKPCEHAAHKYSDVATSVKLRDILLHPKCQ